MTTWIRLRPLHRLAIAGITFLVSPGIAIPAPMAIPVSTPRPVAGNELADVAAALPAGTLFLVAIPNLPTFRTQFATSALYKIWSDPQVQKFIEKPLAIVKAGLQQNTPPDLDWKITENLFDGPVALALTGVELPKPGTTTPPDFGVVLYAKASSAEKLTAFRSMLGKLARSHAELKVEAKKIGEAEAEVWAVPDAPLSVISAQLGDRFYVSLSQPALETMLSLAKGKGSALSSNATYQKVAAKIATSESPILATYVNVEGILALVNPLLPGPVRAAIDKSGVAGLKAFGFGTAIKDGSFVDTTFVYAPAPRTGILKTWQIEPIDLSHLSIVPKEVTSFGITRMNLAPLWDTFWDSVTAYDATVADQWKKALAGVEQQVGFALKADFLDSLGSEVLSYSKPSATGFPEFMIYLELKNPQKFADCLQKLTAKIPDFKIKEIPVGESKAYYVDLSQLGPAAAFVQPSYGFAGNYLLFSISLQSVRSAISGFGAKDRPSVRDNEGWKALAPSAPQQVCDLSYTDTRQSFESTYNTLRSMLPFALAAAGQELPVDLALLPTADVFTKHLTPGISWGTIDADGKLSRSRSAISSAIILPLVVAAAGVAGIFVARSQVVQRREVDKPGK